jgi:hypothetical protein
MMKRLSAQPFAWISNIRFYSRMKFKKSDFPEFNVEPTLLKIKKCLVWNPNELREAYSGRGSNRK